MLGLYHQVCSCKNASSQSLRVRFPGVLCSSESSGRCRAVTNGIPVVVVVTSPRSVGTVMVPWCTCPTSHLSLIHI
eukprot:2600079-Amphidinium_carterae.1